MVVLLESDGAMPALTFYTNGSRPGSTGCHMFEASAVISLARHMKVPTVFYNDRDCHDAHDAHDAHDVRTLKRVAAVASSRPSCWSSVRALETQLFSINAA